MSLAADVLENIKQINSQTQTIVFGYIHQLQRTLLSCNFSESLYTIPDSITFQTILFYYIDYEQASLYSDVYNMFLDPEFCGLDIELLQWYDALQNNLNFTNTDQDMEMQKEIFDYMDKDRDGWIHRSDFVIFITSRFENRQLIKLQTLLLNAIEPIIYDSNNETYIDHKAKADSCRKQRLSTLEMHYRMVQKGIIPRKVDEPNTFEHSNVMNWVIHQVINWMDNIGMSKYGKYFADFERPMSGQRILNNKNIYQFRLQIDFEIDMLDALYIIKERDKLRTLLPKDDKLIDYVEEAKWLNMSFELLSEMYMDMKNDT